MPVIILVLECIGEPHSELTVDLSTPAFSDLRYINGSDQNPEEIYSLLQNLPSHAPQAPLAVGVQDTTFLLLEGVAEHSLNELGLPVGGHIGLIGPGTMTTTQDFLNRYSDHRQICLALKHYYGAPVPDSTPPQGISTKQKSAKTAEPVVAVEKKRYSVAGREVPFPVLLSIAQEIAADWMRRQLYLEHLRVSEVENISGRSLELDVYPNSVVLASSPLVRMRYDVKRLVSPMMCLYKTQLSHIPPEEAELLPVIVGAMVDTVIHLTAFYSPDLCVTDATATGEGEEDPVLPEGEHDYPLLLSLDDALHSGALSFTAYDLLPSLTSCYKLPFNPDPDYSRPQEDSFAFSDHTKPLQPVSAYDVFSSTIGRLRSPAARAHYAQMLISSTRRFDLKNHLKHVIPDDNRDVLDAFTKLSQRSIVLRRSELQELVRLFLRESAEQLSSQEANTLIRKTLVLHLGDALSRDLEKEQGRASDAGPSSIDLEAALVAEKQLDLFDRHYFLKIGMPAHTGRGKLAYFSALMLPEHLPLVTRAYFEPLTNSLCLTQRLITPTDDGIVRRSAANTNPWNLYYPLHKAVKEFLYRMAMDIFHLANVEFTMAAMYCSIVPSYSQWSLALERCTVSEKTSEAEPLPDANIVKGKSKKPTEPEPVQQTPAKYSLCCRKRPDPTAFINFMAMQGSGEDCISPHRIPSQGDIPCFINMVLELMTEECMHRYFGPSSPIPTTLEETSQDLKSPREERLVTPAQSQEQEEQEKQEEKGEECPTPSCETGSVLNVEEFNNISLTETESTQQPLALLPLLDDWLHFTTDNSPSLMDQLGKISTLPLESLANVINGLRSKEEEQPRATSKGTSRQTKPPPPPEPELLAPQLGRVSLELGLATLFSERLGDEGAMFALQTLLGPLNQEYQGCLTTTTDITPAMPHFVLLERRLVYAGSTATPTHVSYLQESTSDLNKEMLTQLTMLLSPSEPPAKGTDKTKKEVIQPKPCAEALIGTAYEPSSTVAITPASILVAFQEAQNPNSLQLYSGYRLRDQSEFFLLVGDRAVIRSRPLEQRIDFCRLWSGLSMTVLPPVGCQDFADSLTLLPDRSVPSVRLPTVKIPTWKDGELTLTGARSLRSTANIRFNDQTSATAQGYSLTLRFPRFTLSADLEPEEGHPAVVLQIQDLFAEASDPSTVQFAQMTSLAGCGTKDQDLVRAEIDLHVGCRLLCNGISLAELHPPSADGPTLDLTLSEAFCSKDDDIEALPVFFEDMVRELIGLVSSYSNREQVCTMATQRTTLSTDDGTKAEPRMILREAKVVPHVLTAAVLECDPGALDDENYTQETKVTALELPFFGVLILWLHTCGTLLILLENGDVLILEDSNIYLLKRSTSFLSLLKVHSAPEIPFVSGIPEGYTAPIYTSPLLLYVGQGFPLWNVFFEKRIQWLKTRKVLDRVSFNPKRLLASRTKNGKDKNRIFIKDSFTLVRNISNLAREEYARFPAIYDSYMEMMKPLTPWRLHHEAFVAGSTAIVSPLRGVYRILLGSLEVFDADPLGKSSTPFPPSISVLDWIGNTIFCRVGESSDTAILETSPEGEETTSHPAQTTIHPILPPVNAPEVRTDVVEELNRVLIDREERALERLRKAEQPPVEETVTTTVTSKGSKRPDKKSAPEPPPEPKEEEPLEVNRELVDIINEVRPISISSGLELFIQHFKEKAISIRPEPRSSSTKGATRKTSVATPTPTLPVDPSISTEPKASLLERHQALQYSTTLLDECMKSMNGIPLPCSPIILPRYLIYPLSSDSSEPLQYDVIDECTGILGDNQPWFCVSEADVAALHYFGTIQDMVCSPRYSYIQEENYTKLLTIDRLPRLFSYLYLPPLTLGVWKVICTVRNALALNSVGRTQNSDERKSRAQDCNEQFLRTLSSLHEMGETRAAIVQEMRLQSTRSNECFYTTKERNKLACDLIQSGEQARQTPQAGCAPFAERFLSLFDPTNAFLPRFNATDADLIEFLEMHIFLSRNSIEGLRNLEVTKCRWSTRTQEREQMTRTYKQVSFDTAMTSTAVKAVTDYLERLHAEREAKSQVPALVIDDDASSPSDVDTGMSEQQALTERYRVDKPARGVRKSARPDRQSIAPAQIANISGSPANWKRSFTNDDVEPSELPLGLETLTQPVYLGRHPSIQDVTELLNATQADDSLNLSETARIRQAAGRVFTQSINRLPAPLQKPVAGPGLQAIPPIVNLRQKDLMILLKNRLLTSLTLDLHYDKQVLRLHTLEPLIIPAQQSVEVRFTVQKLQPTTLSISGITPEGEQHRIAIDCVCKLTHL